MLALPWAENDKSSTQLLDEEVKRQLKIMANSKPDSEEYRKALSAYKELHEHSVKDAQIEESKKARWFSAIVTGGLALVTITAEAWTPVTSKWASTVMRPFRSEPKF